MLRFMYKMGSVISFPSSCFCTINLYDIKEGVFIVVRHLNASLDVKFAPHFHLMYNQKRVLYGSFYKKLYFHTHAYYELNGISILI